MSGSVLTVGETMALLDPAGEGDLAYGASFTLRAAGAESNFAIALSRLGVRVTWVSRLGTDALGDMIMESLVREGIDVRFVQRDPEAPTGLYLKSRAAGGTAVHYYRRGSAASRLEPADVPDEVLDGVQLVHLTGITTALSASARALVLDLARKAHGAGVTVLFDPNWRPSLWSSAAAAAAAQRDLLPYVDWYLCGEAEGRLLLSASSAAEVLVAAHAAGAGAAVVRIGARGALVSAEEGPVEVAPPRLVTIRDEVGAGDAFAAGFAYGLLNDQSPVECARLGNLLAGAALSGTGDWETLPTLADIADSLRTPTG